jgi:hypothetical protein
MLVLPAMILAFAAPHHSHTLPLTAGEAFRATDSHIERKVRSRLRGTYRGLTGCSAHATYRRRRRSPRTTHMYPRWRCHVEIRGNRFPRPCRAEAFVTGTHRKHVLRIDWLEVSRYCRS